MVPPKEETISLPSRIVEQKKKTRWENFQRFLKLGKIRFKRWFGNDLVKMDDPTHPTG